MATGLWIVPGVPHKGWECVAMEELAEFGDETCEMCQKQRIKYVHVMRHEGYEDQLRCGRVCAGNMSEDYVGAVEREKGMKRLASHRRAWIAAQVRQAAAKALWRAERERLAREKAERAEKAKEIAAYWIGVGKAILAAGVGSVMAQRSVKEVVEGFENDVDYEPNKSMPSLFVRLHRLLPEAAKEGGSR